MTRLSIATAISLALICTAGACAQPQFPANGGFEDGTAAWSLPDGAQFEGGALALSRGQAASAPSAEPLRGWQKLEVRLKGPGPGAESSLSVGLVAEDSPSAGQVALSAAEAASGWHTLSAEVLPPPGVPAVAVMQVAGDGPWLIDSVSVTPIDLPEPEPSKSPAVIPEALPQDWEPDGLLDAIERPLGTLTELLVPVGGLEVGMPDEVTVSRAHRGSVRLIVSSRAMGTRELSVSVTGPPGFFAPDRTVTIRPGRDTVFNASVQAFFVGTRWARMTFRSGDHEASAPIRVTVEPSYPAPGVAFSDGASVESLADTLSAASIPLAAAPTGPDLPEHLTRLRFVAPPWSGEALESAAAHADGTADFMALHYARDASPEADPASTTGLLRAALNNSAGVVSTLGPPIDLQDGLPPEVSDADLATVSQLGAAGAIAAPTLRLPVLEARPIRSVSLDRKPVESAQPAWTALSQRLALDTVCSAIRAEARLPLFFSDLAARPTGSAAADAAVLARALIVCAHQGATGWTIPARPEDAPEGAAAFCAFGEDGALNGATARVYSELSRELAAAIPLMVLKQTPEIGTAPDARVAFRPFLRNDEGILALWNSTGAPVDLIFETRTQPLDVHTVSVGPDGVRREYQGSFKFSEAAVRLNRPVVLVTLGPSEVKVLSMQLARPHEGWLASVEPMPKIKRGSSGDRKSFQEQWEEKTLYR